MSVHSEEALDRIATALEKIAKSLDYIESNTSEIQESLSNLDELGECFVNGAQGYGNSLRIVGNVSIRDY